MRKRLLALLVAGLLAPLAPLGCRRPEKAAAPVAPLPDGGGAAAAAVPENLTLAQLVNRYGAALGGRDRLLSLETVRMTGRIARFRGQAELPILVEKERSGNRYLRRVGAGAATVVQAVDGKTAWEVDPAMGIPHPAPMDPGRAARFFHRASIEGPLLDYAAEPGRVTLLGKETVEGVAAYRLRLYYHDGTVGQFLIDAGTFLPWRQIDINSGRSGQEPGDVVTTFASFRPVDGLFWPFAERTVTPNVDQGTSWDKIELNVTLPDSDFQMPAH